VFVYDWPISLTLTHSFDPIYVSFYIRSILRFVFFFFFICSQNADLLSPSVSVNQVQLSKSLDTLGGILSVNPSYNLANGKPDAVVGYSYGPTNVKVDARRKRLTVTHSFGSNRNTISPTLSAGGDFSLSYSRQLADGKLITTWTPDDSITVRWTDGGWDATIMAPLEGYYHTSDGIKVSMKRNIDVPL
jgi:hypothetical protein